MEFYVAASCPYSYLMAQQLQRALGDTGLKVRSCFIVGLEADVDPAPELREGHGPRDCASLARFYALDFPAEWVVPDPDALSRAERILAATPSIEAVVAVGRALWAGGGAAALDAAEVTYRAADAATTQRLLAANAARQRRGGHYQPGTLRHLGEWFGGPLRTPIVTSRLGLGDGDCLRRRPEPGLARVATGTPMELWFSFRSPYSYLAIAQLQRWRDAGETVPIVFRPILPMVMRGLAVPKIKRMYLVKDSAREARQLGIPFGRVADPVGDGARRCLAVCAHLISVDAGDTSRAFDFAVAAARGIWSEGRDVATDAGLWTVGQRGGVTRAELDAALSNIPAGEALAEANRDAMTGELGLWGVPSFRTGDFVTWGQDRLALVRYVLGLD